MNTGARENDLASTQPGEAVDPYPMITYFTDTAGHITGLSFEAWDAFARANDAHHLADHGNILGRPITAFLHGSHVRTSLEMMLEKLRLGVSESIVYAFSCDSPTEIRSMTLTISAEREQGDLRGFRFESRTLGVERRSVAAVIAASLAPRDARLPLQTICSYCKQLEYPRGSGSWVDALTYERRGGSSRVRLSHGVCPECEAILTRQIESGEHR